MTTADIIFNSNCSLDWLDARERRLFEQQLRDEELLAFQHATRRELDDGDEPIELALALPSDMPRRARPPAPTVKELAAAAGMRQAWAAVGFSKRIPDLVRVEQWLFDEGLLSNGLVHTTQGYFNLTGDLAISSKLLLYCLDCVDGQLPALTWLLPVIKLGFKRKELGRMARLLRCPALREQIVAMQAWYAEHRAKLPEFCSYLAFRFLARQPEALRWALLHHRAPATLMLRALNWKQWRLARNSVKIRQESLPPHVRWQQALGTPAPASVELPSLGGFKFGALTRLCQALGVSVARPDDAEVMGWLQPMVTLVKLFEHEGAIRQFVTKTQGTWSLKSVHDAGQFNLPTARETWTPAKWAAFCLKHPAAVHYARHFASLERKRLPVRLTELRARVAGITYPRVSKRWLPLAELSASLHLSRSDFMLYKRFWERATVKPADCMPPVQVDGAQVGLPGWQLRKLDSHDLRGPMLGLLTGCCQHLTGAASSAAAAGVTSPFSAFYVVEAGGDVVAQMWVWRNTTGGLVVDSVESINRTPEMAKNVAALLQAGHSQLLKASLGITALYVGQPHSGISTAVAKSLGISPAAKSVKTTPAEELGYADSRLHYLWAGAPSAEMPLPDVVGYARYSPATDDGDASLGNWLRAGRGVYGIDVDFAMRMELEDAELRRVYR